MEISNRFDKGQRIWRIEATEDGRSLGGLYYDKKPDEIKLGYLYVKEKGQGVGRMLLEALVSTAKENQAHTITGSFIPVPETSDAAQDLYESFGFVIDPKSQKMVKILKPDE